MIVVTVFLSILSQMKFNLVQNRDENCHHDHIPFINVKGNGNLVFSVYAVKLNNPDNNCDPFISSPNENLHLRPKNINILHLWTKNIDIMSIVASVLHKEKYISDFSQIERNISICWKFSFWLLTKRNSFWLIINRKTVIMIMFLSIRN